MVRPLLALALFALPLASNKEVPPPADGPAYTEKGELKMPENYREWVFLTSGVDMSYAATEAPEHSVFDNVFVNPSAYREFQKTGTWPDKTVLVLEVRGAEGAPPSINKRGHLQSQEVRILEVHVKDSSREGGWTFYGVKSKIGIPFPRTAACYSCHEQHGIVDTTFTQFYPTLLPLAKEKKTIRVELLKELELPAPGTAK